MNRGIHIPKPIALRSDEHENMRANNSAVSRATESRPQAVGLGTSPSIQVLRTRKGANLFDRSEWRKYAIRTDFVADSGAHAKSIQLARPIFPNLSE